MKSIVSRINEANSEAGCEENESTYLVVCRKSDEYPNVELELLDSTNNY